MDQITAFRTADGAIFESKELAESHELGSRMASKLDAFSLLKICPYPSGIANTQMRRSIIAWELSWELEQMKPKDSPPGKSVSEELGFSYRTSHCLKATGITTMDILLTQSKQSLLKIPNLGKASLHEIVIALLKRGLQLPINSADSSVG